MKKWCHFFVGYVQKGKKRSEKEILPQTRRKDIKKEKNYKMKEKIIMERQEGVDH